MQQFTQGFLPSSFANVWTSNAERRANSLYHLRNKGDISIPPARLSSVENHPLHAFPRAWIQFEDHNIKIQREKHIFNPLLKKHFIDNLNSNYMLSIILPFMYWTF